MFTTEMMTETQKWIARRLRCPELQAIALVLAWYRWRTRPDVPLRQHAYYAARQALHGRDLPGVDCERGPDAWKLERWQGGEMKHLPDGKPGPVKEAIWAEEWEHFWAELTDRERAIADELIEGKQNQEVAKTFGISAPRVTQIRQAMMDKLRE